MENLRKVKEVYHATTTKRWESLKKGIQTHYIGAGKHTDFGQGFYTTTSLKDAIIRAQALKDSDRILENDFTINGLVIAYSLNSKALYNCYNYKEFNPYDLHDWVVFVANNRYSENESVYRHSYKWTYGPVADGKNMYNEVIEFKNGNIDAKTLIQMIEPKNEQYDQLVFHDDKLAGQALLEPYIKKELKK